MGFLTLPKVVQFCTYTVRSIGWSWHLQGHPDSPLLAPRPPLQRCAEGVRAWRITTGRARASQADRCEAPLSLAPLQLIARAHDADLSRATIIPRPPCHLPSCCPPCLQRPPVHHPRSLLDARHPLTPFFPAAHTPSPTSWRLLCPPCPMRTMPSSRTSTRRRCVWSTVPGLCPDCWVA